MNVVSFWKPGMLFDFLHVGLVMVVFGWCWSFVAYGCLLAFFYFLHAFFLLHFCGQSLPSSLLVYFCFMLVYFVLYQMLFMLFLLFAC